MGEDISSWKSNNKEESININVDNGEQGLNDDDESTVHVPPLPMPANFLWVIAMILVISPISILLVFAYICMQYGPVSVEAAPWLLIIMTCWCASSASLWYIQAYKPQLTRDKKQGGEFDMQRAKLNLKAYCESFFISIYLFIYGKLLEDAKLPSYMINLTYLVSAVSLVFNLVTLGYSFVILRQYYCSRRFIDEEDPLIIINEGRGSSPEKPALHHTMGEDIGSWKNNSQEEEAVNISVGEQDLNDDESTVPVPPLPMPAMIATISISILVVIAYTYTCIQYGPVSDEALSWLLIFSTCYCASSVTLCYIQFQAYKPQLTRDKKQGDEFDKQRAKVSLKVYCAFSFIWIYFIIYGKLLKDAKLPSYMINPTYLLSAVTLVFNLVTLVYSLVILRQLSRVCSIQDEEDPLIASKV